MYCSLPGSSVHGIFQARMCCHFLLQGIFPTQGLNLHLLHWQVDTVPGSHQRSPTVTTSTHKGLPRSFQHNRPGASGSVFSPYNQCKTYHRYTWNIVNLLLTATSVVSYSVQPQRQQPTRLPRPWDSPGKNTGVGCLFLLQCMKVKSESEATQSCPTPSNPMDRSLPGSSVHGIFQARVLEWGAIAFSV